VAVTVRRLDCDCTGCGFEYLARLWTTDPHPHHTLSASLHETDLQDLTCASDGEDHGRLVIRWSQVAWPSWPQDDGSLGGTLSPGT
jgi:hypothetical protein